jgi:hypothetical protein
MRFRVCTWRQVIKDALDTAVPVRTGISFSCLTPILHTRVFKVWWRIIATKKEPLEHNFYFVIQPLHFVSRILGLSPFHIDPNYTFRDKAGCTFCHITQATVMILQSLCGACNSVLTLGEYNEPTLNVIVGIVWIINVLVSHLTSILALLFSITRNRNHTRKVMSFLSPVNNKLFRNKSKQSAYSQQRSHVKMHLWITFILFGFVGTFSLSLYKDSQSSALCVGSNTLKKP